VQEHLKRSGWLNQRNVSIQVLVKRKLLPKVSSVYHKLVQSVAPWVNTCFNRISSREASGQVVVELAMACSSAGDAFRSLDQKDLVKNTFVLVSGDVVVNMDLASAYREHLARRLASPAAIMTLARPLSGCPPGMQPYP